MEDSLQASAWVLRDVTATVTRTPPRGLRQQRSGITMIFSWQKQKRTFAGTCFTSMRSLSRVEDAELFCCRSWGDILKTLFDVQTGDTGDLKKKMTLMGTDITQVRESNINSTERPPGSPFQSKGLDGTPRPGGVQKSKRNPIRLHNEQ